MAEDIDFIKAMHGVRRLRNSNATNPVYPKPRSTRVIRSEIRNRANLSAFTADTPPDRIINIGNAGHCNEANASELFFLRNGLQKKTLRDLKKGKTYPVKTVVDLHGLTKADAEKEIEGVMTDLCSASGRLGCLLIIHGKGARSANGPVLKTFVAQYLKTLYPVKAYCSAQVHDGGTGSLYVLIKK